MRRLCASQATVSIHHAEMLGEVRRGIAQGPVRAPKLKILALLLLHYAYGSFLVLRVVLCEELRAFCSQVTDSPEFSERSLNLSR